MEGSLGSVESIQNSAFPFDATESSGEDDYWKYSRYKQLQLKCLRNVTKTVYRDLKQYFQEMAEPPPIFEHPILNFDEDIGKNQFTWH